MFSSAQHTKCLIISAGRCETYLKFKELSYDFFQQGFNIYIIDHRGQGLSQRMLNNPNKGYVKNFDDYAKDLHYFIENIVEPNCQQSANLHKLPLYLLAHSMGGAISVRYLQKYPNKLNAIVLSSPMIAFNNGGMPNWLSDSIIKSGNKINQWFSRKQWYFFGQTDYQTPEFNNNPLSHSKIRFKRFTELYKTEPKIQLGGVTVHWLQQAVITTENIFKNLSNIKVPLLVIQSGSDKIVDNQAQNKFCALLHQQNKHSCPEGKPIVITGANHELFIESDLYRNAALSSALNWFNQHQ
jgi:lysophospholipase